MDFESKRKMVLLGNKLPESKNDFQEYVINNLKYFDNQSWSMFVNLITLVSDDMRQDINFWESIHKHISENDISLSTLRECLRFELMKSICEEFFPDKTAKSCIV